MASNLIAMASSWYLLCTPQGLIHSLLNEEFCLEVMRRCGCTIKPWFAEGEVCLIQPHVSGAATDDSSVDSCLSSWNCVIVFCILVHLSHAELLKDQRSAPL